MIYLANSAVMPAGCYGNYRYKPVSLWVFSEILKAAKRGGYLVSTIGYQQTAELIERWTGVPVEVNRVEMRLHPGDSVLVVRMRYRVPDPKAKGAPVSEDPEDWELAVADYLG